LQEYVKNMSIDSEAYPVPPGKKIDLRKWLTAASAPQAKGHPQKAMFAGILAPSG